MAKGGMDFDEFKKLAGNFKQMEKNSKQFIEDFLLKMALRLLAATKKRTPVDVGDLRNSWYLSGIARRGNDVMINIVNPKLYASFVENGHWQQPGRFIPGSFLGDKFEYIPGYPFGMTLSNPWVEGVYMLTISLAEIERQMPKRLEREWKQYFENLVKV